MIQINKQEQKYALTFSKSQLRKKIGYADLAKLSFSRTLKKISNFLKFLRKSKMGKEKMKRKDVGKVNTIYTQLRYIAYMIIFMIMCIILIKVIN